MLWGLIGVHGGSTLVWGLVGVHGGRLPTPGALLHISRARIILVIVTTLVALALRSFLSICIAAASGRALALLFAPAGSGRLSGMCN